MTDAKLPDELLEYFAARERDRWSRSTDRFNELTAREQYLVWEAAVMGYVQGVRSVPRSYTTPIPPDREIVDPIFASIGVIHAVITGADSFTDLYPVLSGSVRGLIERIVRQRGPVDRAALTAAVAALMDKTAEHAEQEISDLIEDEIITDVDGVLHIAEHDEEEDDE